MTTIDWALDGSLAVALPLLAWRVVNTTDLAKSVVLFIALGLLAALGWSRLGAPDVALVEAAVGAGLTGALLMTTLGWVNPRSSARPGPLARRVWIPLLLAGVAVVLGSLVFLLPDPSAGLRDDVNVRLAPGGVSHPVTAVLLDFRGYDTLLEVMVLVAAAIGTRSQTEPVTTPLELAAAGPLQGVLVRMLIPGIVLVAGYLLWSGSHAPGGAFQAGAILGGGAILLLLTRTVSGLDLSGAIAWRSLMLVGPMVFLLVAAAPLVTGGQLLEYPVEWSGALILLIECALTLSIAAMLTMFFPQTPLLARARTAVHREAET